MNELASGPLAPHGVAKKTAQGALALGIRQVVVMGTRILGGIFLARLLTPAQFGIYAIVLYLQTFLTAFGDAGLGASLIRQPDEPNGADYRAVFTVQQLLVVFVGLIMWLAAPWIATRYHLRPQDDWLFRLVALSFFATSFMVIPLVRLERHLAFHKVAVIESAQAIVFNVLAVYFAWRGMGAYSFVWALLLRSVVGVVLANWISPWKMGWHWDWALIRSHLSFGLPFQGIQVISLLKDSVSPIFIGILLGTADVGYVTWAAMIAAYPVLGLFVLQRLYMPAFARLQHHRAQLASLVENVLWLTNAITAPLSILTLVMIVPITTVIYGEKWLVALPYFYFFWLANIFVPTATPALGLLNALGKSKLALLFAVIWMAGTWVVGAPLIVIYGAIGLAIATFAVQFSNFWLYRAAQRQVPFRVLAVAAPVWVLASISGAGIYFACRLHPPHDVRAITMDVGSGLLLYIAGVYLFYKDKIHSTWASLKGAA